MNSGEPASFQNECSIKPIDGKIQQGIACRQSDYPIVSKKFRNGNGEKGVAVIHREARDTSAGHRAGQRMRTKLASQVLRAGDNRNYEFTTLAYLLNEDFLKRCFRELKRNKTPGVDGVTVEEYAVNLEDNVRDLVVRLKEKRYIPQPVKRVYIPKSGGGKRGLGIPTVEDKVVQTGVKIILEEIFEVDFLDVSYGFRPGRSCHGAIDALDKVIMFSRVNHIVDMDIKSFYDTIDRKWLMRCLKQRVTDPNLLRIIGRFLKAGIMEEGEFYDTGSGTPQGGVLSPVLANIYLHYIVDLWFERVEKKRYKGFVHITRYADDFIVCFEIGSEAEAFGRRLRQRLDKFGLKIAESKSKIIEFGRYPWYQAQRNGRKLATFDFLGFTHYCGKSRKGYFKLGRKTADTRLRQKVRDMNEWLKKVRNEVELKEWWKVLRMKLFGHYRYYGISGNMEKLKEFNRLTSKLAYKWVNRRSQKKSYNFKQFCRFMEFNPLPQPRIYHSTYA